jgi:hypothetical protein
MRADLVFGCTTRVLIILELLTWHSETFDSIVKNRGKSQSHTEIKSLPMIYRDKFSIDALLLSPVTPHVQSVTGAFIQLERSTKTMNHRVEKGTSKE